MHNKTILITGSTDGIGLQTAVELAQMGGHIIVHGRNQQKAKLAREGILKQTSNEHIEYVVGDLSSLDEIRQMAKDIHERFDKIDVLINNAGVIKKQRELNQDGFEMTFAVNHLSYFFLTGLLLDLIEKSEYSRIVNVASMAHASSLDFDNLQSEKYFDSYDAYSRSKLCNILFTYKLAEMLTDTHISANVLHPGVIGTKLLREGWGSGGSSLSNGVRNSVYLATNPELKNVSGKYFSNLKVVRSSSISYDIDIQNKLWEKSEKMTDFHFQL
ncbi:MAG: SDR family oxidoreductase [Bacteroidales bacterium]|nr:SDR family oxidoreductase [Bacteroidales bacterium]MCF8402412.1 SDR family oxidoreductase [Bacteroidales bacterium]